MNVKDIIADSNLAFLNQENEKALSLAKEAIKLAPKNPNAYKCAGNACMSMERYDDAIKNFSMAVKYDSNNGNRYYDLGFALATVEKLPDAMKNFVKAEELGCIPENLAQLYNILGIICFDIGRYNDALVNLNKAEQLIGIDTDILQRKAIIYGIKGDIRNGLMTTNQIKLIAPSKYIGYQLAVKLLVQANRLEDAEKELRRAEKYSVPTMDYFFDCMTLELEKYRIDKDNQHLYLSLDFIQKALDTINPTSTNVMESYINAAEIYLQLESPEQTINCLNAAHNPVNAYNKGFKVVMEELGTKELTAYDVEEMIEADKIKIAETFGDYGLEDLVENTEPDWDGNREYFTEIEEEEQHISNTYRLDETEEINYTPEITDQINRLYVGAYTLKKDFDKVIEYSHKLIASDNVQISYIGIYTEANAMKEMNLPEALDKYQEVIKFFRNVMIKDPTDIMAVNFRIQCYIDIGCYDEAEQLCSLLTKEAREPLQDRIDKAKSGGK